MRASGVSFLTIARPVLLVAVCTAIFVVWVNEWFVPRYSPWAAQLKSERFDQQRITKADNIVYRNSSAYRTWNVDRLLFADGTSLSDVKITIDRPHGTRERMIHAERADFLDGEWWLSGVKTQHYDSSGQEIATMTPELDSIVNRLFPELDELPEDFIMQNRPWQFNSTGDRLRYLKTHPEIVGKERDDLIYDVWERIVSPWACVIITLFAIPAGIASGRQSVFRGIVGALGMFFAYYGLSIGGMILAKVGWAPPIIAALTPGIIFLILGIRSFYRQR